MAGAVQRNGSLAVPKQSQSDTSQAQKTIGCGWLSLTNRQELCAELGLPTSSDDGQLVSASFEAWGPRFSNRYRGHYAFAIFDADTETVIAGRDQVGPFPLFVHRTASATGISPSAAMLRAVNTQVLTPNQGWVANYLVGRRQDSADTAYEQIRKVLPGQLVEIHRDRLTSTSIDVFHDDPPWSNRPRESWVAAYRDALTSAIVKRAPAAGSIGSETSGGIDSSGIIGLLAASDESMPSRMETFAWVSAQDEPQYVLATSMAHRIALNHIWTGNRVPPASINQQDEALQRKAIEILGYPPTTTTAVHQMRTYALCHERGIQTLYSGLGGDECVSYGAPEAIREFLDRGKVTQALACAGYLPGRRHLQALARAQSRDSQPMSATVARNLGLVARDVAARVTRGESEGPPQWSHSVNGAIINPSTGRLRPRVSAYWAPRAEESSLVSLHFSVNSEWPLLDPNLIQQYLSTPAVEKHWHGWGRYLHRRAISPHVPRSVAWKRSKNMGPVAHRRSSRGGPPESQMPLWVKQLHPNVQSMIDLPALRDASGRRSIWRTATNLSFWFDYLDGKSAHVNDV